MHPYGLVFLALFALAACGAKSADSVTATERAEPAKDMRPRTATDGVAATDGAAAGTQTAERALPDNRKIIRNGSIAFETENHDATLVSVRAIVSSNAGVLFSGTANLAESGRKSGNYVFKVPGERFDRLLDRLARLPGVQTMHSAASDVTLEWSDLAGRLRSAEEIRRSLTGILQTRAGDMESVLKVEREIHRVTDTIETLRGRLRALDEQTEYSTLSVSIREPRALASVEPDIFAKLGSAFIMAFNVFVNVIAGLIASLGVLVPLGALVYVAIRSIKRLRRRKPAARD